MGYEMLGGLEVKDEAGYRKIKARHFDGAAGVETVPLPSHAANGHFNRPDGLLVL